MMPGRGVSMSAISMNAMEVKRGRIRSNLVSNLTPRELYQTNRFLPTAIAIIRPHAAIGIRFHQEAWVYPCELNTSFMPETARATTGVGCTLAGSRTADHNSLCS